MNATKKLTPEQLAEIAQAVRDHMQQFNARYDEQGRVREPGSTQPAPTK